MSESVKQAGRGKRPNKARNLTKEEEEEEVLWKESKFGSTTPEALERFSNECRKTKTKVITPANHNKHKLSNENQSELEANTCNRRQARENACECEQVATDWFEFYS